MADGSASVFWLKPKAHFINPEDEAAEEVVVRKCFVNVSSGQIKDRLLPEDNEGDWLETMPHLTQGA